MEIIHTSSNTFYKAAKLRTITERNLTNRNSFYRLKPNEMGSKRKMNGVKQMKKKCLRNNSKRHLHKIKMYEFEVNMLRMFSLKNENNIKSFQGFASQKYHKKGTVILEFQMIL